MSDPIDAAALDRDSYPLRVNSIDPDARGGGDGEPPGGKDEDGEGQAADSPKARHRPEPIHDDVVLSEAAEALLSHADEQSNRSDADSGESQEPDDNVQTIDRDDEHEESESPHIKFEA